MCYECSECGDNSAGYVEKRYPDTQLIIRKYICRSCLKKLGDNMTKIANFMKLVK
jgi:hypothetical protein